ncbi:MAG: bifunctional UDP-N-acetylmuramoyl-tripeptide:D-alanyl-D-alanine ligase/alanine racemase [Schleiferiaceae bacterium]
MTLDQISALLSTPLHNGIGDRIIRDLQIDTRKIGEGKNSLFFALVGPSNDGHSHIESAYRSGVRAFVVEREIDLPSDAGYLIVDSSLRALQDIASFVRNQFHNPVLGITGSNGKTIVKEWIYQLINSKKNVLRSPKSYNSQIGVPLSIWPLEQHFDLALLEAGISMPGEMENLEKVILPTVGIFTNIGSAHQVNFSSFKEKIHEKLKLFIHSKELIYCLDHVAISDGVREVLPKVQSRTWSFHDNRADLFFHEVVKGGQTTLLKGFYKGADIEFSLPFTDDSSVENACHAIMFCLVLDIEIPYLKKKLANLEPVAMRLELKRGIENSLLINDAYNSDLESIRIALDFLRQQSKGKEKLVILSDVFQTGIESEDVYSEIASWLKGRGIENFVGIGPELMSFGNLFPEGSEFYDSVEAFMDVFDTHMVKDKAILLKGARSFTFEKISQKLEEKIHQTILEINLNALENNLGYWRSKIQSKTKIMAMVKAFSYGAGTDEIARFFQQRKVDYLTVAYVDEGVELRKAGITLPIMVMNPDPSSLRSCIENKLEPEIFSTESLMRFANVLDEYPEISHFPVHLKIDTGMHRLGFELGRFPELVGLLHQYNKLKVASAFSHLAAADERKQRDFTRTQISRFTRFTRDLQESLGYPFLRHILNSAGTSFYPEAQFDMVRIGISLYGFSASPEDEEKLQPVGFLKTLVSQIKELNKGETVGYSRSFVAQRPTVSATLPIGYADGLPRSLSNGVGHVIIKGQKAPIIGRVCMDMTMVDVTGLNVDEGDEVEIFGRHQSVVDIAKAANTIPYEILTGISSRVKRVFYQE